VLRRSIILPRWPRLVSRQEPFRFAPANKNDYPEIRCLNRRGTLDNKENYLIRKLFTLGPRDDLYIQPGAENSSTSQRFLTVSDDMDSSQAEGTIDVSGAQTDEQDEECARAGVEALIEDG
jgi:hypothetical protein